MPKDFITLPDEVGSGLQTLANLLWGELRKRGFRVRAEPDPLEYPARPTILGRRNHETHFFLVKQAVTEDEIETWIGYAQSCTSDTRVSICYSDNSSVSAAQATALRRKGVGLILHSPVDGLRFDQAAADLAFHANAPRREALKPRVQQLLGEALDRLDQRDWRAAFEDACTVLEDECRTYLLKKARLGTLKYQSNKKIVVPTKDDIRGMSLGGYKNVFCGMVSQNVMEAHLCTALTKLNPDRIRRAHFRRAGQPEAALRRRVGKHFWLIANALTMLAA